MVSDGFNDRSHATVTDAKTFTSHAADVGFAAGCAIERDVADDDVLFGNERGLFGRINDDFAAGQPFTDVIVRVAFEEEGHSLRHESTEALARAAGKMDFD